MRTAADFNRFYTTIDPWSLTRTPFRDRVYRRFLPRMVRAKTVLELGCEEGHATAALFSGASEVTGIDISDVAISRAKARNLSNAKFRVDDLLQTSFEGFDIIAAMECVYYLSPDEQQTFFRKVAREHGGKLLVLSSPIIGDGQHRRYFTHSELSEIFKRHSMTVLKYHNIVIDRRTVVTTFLATASRLVPAILDRLPDAYVFQRCYIIRTM